MIAKRIALALALLCPLFFMACKEEPRLNAAGSTFIYPVMSKWAFEYEKARHVEVNYQSIGSGAGIQQTIARTVDFGCSDAPMNDGQLARARAAGGDVAHIPLAMGAIVPAYNLPGISQPLKFNGTALADIFLGKITQWNDPAIAALNPGVALPALGILVVHRSDGSGTSAIWTDYLSKVSDEWQTKVGNGTSVSWPAGIGQKGNEGVAGQVERTPGAIGYIELIYALQNRMPFGLVKNHDGNFIRADLASVTAAGEGALAHIPDDLRYSLTDAPGKNAYPICGTTWAILYVHQPMDKGKQVVDFLRWVTHDGQRYNQALDYAPLPPGLMARIDKKLDSITVSSQ